MNLEEIRKIRAGLSDAIYVAAKHVGEDDIFDALEEHIWEATKAAIDAEEYIRNMSKLEDKAYLNATTEGVTYYAKGVWNISDDGEEAVLWNDEKYCSIERKGETYNWKVGNIVEINGFQGEMVAIVAYEDYGKTHKMRDSFLCCERIYYG